MNGSNGRSPWLWARSWIRSQRMYACWEMLGLASMQRRVGREVQPEQIGCGAGDAPQPRGLAVAEDRAEVADRPAGDRHRLGEQHRALAVVAARGVDELDRDVLRRCRSRVRSSSAIQSGHGTRTISASKHVSREPFCLYIGNNTRCSSPSVRVSSGRNASSARVKSGLPKSPRAQILDRSGEVLGVVREARRELLDRRRHRVDVGAAPRPDRRRRASEPSGAWSSASALVSSRSRAHAGACSGPCPLRSRSTGQLPPSGAAAQ